VSLDQDLIVTKQPAQDLVALDEALQVLEAVHPRKSQVVELRFFGGLSIEEAGEALHVSPDTVKRDWRFAKLWLLRELSAREGTVTAETAETAEKHARNRERRHDA
jgi:RNA polymerase sigma factor (sigma-70 family)